MLTLPGCLSEVSTATTDDMQEASDGRQCLVEQRSSRSSPTAARTSTNSSTVQHDVGPPNAATACASSSSNQLGSYRKSVFELFSLTTPSSCATAFDRLSVTDSSIHTESKQVDITKQITSTLTSSARPAFSELSLLPSTRPTLTEQVSEQVSDTNVVDLTDDAVDENEHVLIPFAKGRFVNVRRADYSQVKDCRVAPTRLPTDVVMALRKRARTRHQQQQLNELLDGVPARKKARKVSLHAQNPSLFSAGYSSDSDSDTESYSGSDINSSVASQAAGVARLTATTTACSVSTSNSQSQSTSVPRSCDAINNTQTVSTSQSCRSSISTTNELSLRSPAKRTWDKTTKDAEQSDSDSELPELFMFSGRAAPAQSKACVDDTTQPEVRADDAKQPEAGVNDAKQPEARVDDAIETAPAATKSDSHSCLTSPISTFSGHMRRVSSEFDRKHLMSACSPCHKPPLLSKEQAQETVKSVFNRSHVIRCSRADDNHNDVDNLLASSADVTTASGDATVDYVTAAGASTANVQNGESLSTDFNSNSSKCSSATLKIDYSSVHTCSERVTPVPLLSPIRASTALSARLRDVTSCDDDTMLDLNMTVDTSPPGEKLVNWRPLDDAAQQTQRPLVSASNVEAHASLMQKLKAQSGPYRRRRVRMNVPSTANDVSLHSGAADDSHHFATSSENARMTSSCGADADGDVVRSHVPTATRHAPDGSVYRFCVRNYNQNRAEWPLYYTGRLQKNEQFEPFHNAKDAQERIAVRVVPFSKVCTSVIDSVRDELGDHHAPARLKGLIDMHDTMTEFINWFTSSNVEPPLKVLHWLIFDSLLKAPKLCAILNAYTCLRGILHLHPPRDALPFDWSEFVHVLTTLKLERGGGMAQVTDSLTLTRYKLTLTYMIDAMEVEYLNRPLHNRREVRASQCYKWLSADHSSKRLREITQWFMAALTYGDDVTGNVEAALSNLSLDNIGDKNNGKTVQTPASTSTLSPKTSASKSRATKKDDVNSAACETSTQEMLRSAAVPEVGTVLSSIEHLLDITLAVNSAQQERCIDALACGLALEYRQLSCLDDKMRLLDSLRHLQLRLALVCKVLDACHNDVAKPTGGVCRSVQDIIDCYFTSEPPGLPAALSSRTADDVTSEITVSDVNVCTVEQSVEEFAKLLLRCLSDYIKLQKGPDGTGSLSERDVTALQGMSFHVEGLYQRLLTFLPADSGLHDATERSLQSIEFLFCYCDC